MPAPRALPGDRPLLALASIAILAAGASALIAWAISDFYRLDPAVIQPQLYGQDLVTLLAVPVLLAAAWTTARGSTRGRIVLLGGLLYLAYSYLTYSVGVRFNALFLPYLLVLGTSTFALVLGVARFPLSTARDAPRWRRSLAAFLFAIPLLFGALWLVDVLGAYAAGGIPNAAREVEMPTSPIHVLDLAFVLPLSAAAGVLLLRRSPWATPLSGIVLVKAITICLAMLAMGAMALRAGEAVNLPVAGAALVTLAIAGAFSWAYFRGLPAPRALRERARPRVPVSRPPEG